MNFALRVFSDYFRIATNTAKHFMSGKQYDFVASTVFGSLMAGNTSDFVPRKIFVFGVWEPNLTRWTQERLRPGDTFVDVGANLGYYSLLAAGLVADTGRVVAIEASPAITAQLNHNLKLNGTTNVRTVNAAASDRVGTISLYRGPSHNTSQTSIIAGDGFTYESEIAAQPLCEILSAAEIATARIVKIDVEGAEWSVIAGLAPCLAQTRPDLEILVEVSPPRLAVFGRNADDVIETFGSAGFHPYTIENDYSSFKYLPPLQFERPKRLRGAVMTQTDMVFSRTDAAYL